MRANWGTYDPILESTESPLFVYPKMKLYNCIFAELSARAQVKEFRSIWPILRLLRRNLRKATMRDRWRQFGHTHGVSIKKIVGAVFAAPNITPLFFEISRFSGIKVSFKKKVAGRLALIFSP